MADVSGNGVADMEVRQILSLGSLELGTLPS